MKFTKPNSADIAQIKNILSQWIQPTETDNYLSSIKRSIKDCPQFNQQFYIAINNHQVLGITGLTDPLPQTLTHAQTHSPTQLKLLYVDGNFHGKGVGFFLINHIEKIAQSQSYTEILVRSANRYQPQAKTFYEKMGYQKIGEMNKDKNKLMIVFSKILK